jgi:hypothetical protein
MMRELEILKRADATDDPASKAFLTASIASAYVAAIVRFPEAELASVRRQVHDLRAALARVQNLAALATRHPQQFAAQAAALAPTLDADGEALERLVDFVDALSS